MSNPNVQILPADEWTRVATAVTVGVIDIVTSTPIAYFRTYRIPDSSPPVGLQNVKQLFDGEPINATEKVDVYVFPSGGIGKIVVNI